MKNIFKDKVVWITGASSGIGEAMAYEFSKAGAEIILSSRNSAKLECVKKNCRGEKESIDIVPFDITWTDEFPSIVGEALQRWGRIDYLILNAGIVVRDLAQNISEDTCRMVMDTNYFGPVELAKALLPSMKRNGGGHIIVISSLSGKYGVPKLSAYSASKHALHGFFESLRAEVATLDIKISFIIPGFINTDILKNAPDGNGNVSGKNLSVNENGMSPQLCAKKILKAVGKGKEEVLIGRGEILSVYINRFFPKIFSAVIRNHPVRKMKMIMKFI